jgi:hypothetical protein
VLAVGAPTRAEGHAQGQDLQHAGDGVAVTQVGVVAAHAGGQDAGHVDAWVEVPGDQELAGQAGEVDDDPARGPAADERGDVDVHAGRLG